jgi:D-serine deaminase-like pyridoxal phosphate-dependent protein
VDELGLKLDELDTPFLWVDLDVMEENIRYLACYFRRAGVNWRPHTKGIKVPAIARKLVNAGAIGITCAKLGEAEVMASAGINDILIANQIVGPVKYARLAKLCRDADVKISVDSEATLTELSKAALAEGVEIGVVVELDSGMKRAGIPPGKPALALSCLLHDTPGLRYEGLMTWEGHTVALEDFELKEKEINKSLAQLLDTVDLCRKEGLPVNIVSCGGSATYTVSSKVQGITEIQAGGATFCDVAYKKWGAETKQSLYIRSTVTSRSVPDRIICDAGFKAMSIRYFEPQPVGLTGVKKVGVSAEHGVVLLEKPDSSVKVGDFLDFIPGYEDSTVYLHDYLYGIREGRVEVIWPISGRGKIR